ncbi:unnamed protein product [Penicillium roqueforti FM164]|uniref:Genomic scaffold, ProqFM164S02 n=1 Tax=Penicillium roqueforti (strain FM164) TaxID=1365484 RepID=W6Q2Z3_PENRF|nr:unnamed protein product [Penicillium roqueforti FM164]
MSPCTCNCCSGECTSCSCSSCKGKRYTNYPPSTKPTHRPSSPPSSSHTTHTRPGLPLLSN